MKFDNLVLLALNLKLFDGNGNTNVTTDAGLSDDMKTYYSDYLIDQAEAKLVHNQFGQKKPIPENRGKTVEFRKYDPLPKISPDKYLTEGVTPDGQKINMGVINVAVKQYGGYVELSDILLLTAVDNNLTQATKLLGSQAGRTLDTLTREVLNGGTNVQFADGSVLARENLTKDNKLSVACIRRAVRNLKVMNAEPYDDSFVAIIHPDCAYDLMNDPEWKYPHQYKDTEHLYNGEIGKIAGVRFVETTEAKIFAGEGADGIDVYSTLVIGDNAYGTVQLSGGGLEHIVKQLGSSGTADPLNQRATAGWKATHATIRLVEAYMIRIETASTFDAVTVDNLTN